MKLLFLTSRFPYPPHRGDKLKIYNLIKQLSERHEITLMSFIQSKKELQYVPAMKEYCARIETVYLPPWRSWMSCIGKIFSNTPFQNAYFKSSRMSMLLNSVVSSGSFDIMHIHLIRMAQFCLDRDLSIPTILDLTDAGSLYLKRFRDTTSNPFYKLFLNEELRRISGYERHLENFDKSLVCSDVDRDALLHHAPKAKIDILFNGIDIEYYSNHQSTVSEPFRIICTGNMAYHPNADGVLYFVKKIFPLIEKQISEIELYIVGQSPPGKISRLSSARIRVTGFVPDIKEEYLKSSVAVAPIRFGAGTLNKVIEPMALGLPVVTTSLGIEGLPLKNEKDVLVADTPEEFANAVVRLLKDPHLRSMLSTNASTIIRSCYDWKVIAASLEHIYRNLGKQ